MIKGKTFIAAYHKVALYNFLRPISHFFSSMKNETAREGGGGRFRLSSPRRKEKKKLSRKILTYDLRANSLIPPPPRDLRGRLNTDPLVCFYQ